MLRVTSQQAVSAWAVEPQAMALAVTMLDEAGKPVLPESRLAPMPAYACELELNVAALPPGKYQAHGVIVEKGKQVAEQLSDNERRAVETAGGKFKIIPFVPGKSTTALLEQISQL